MHTKNRIVVFFIPGIERVTGGALQIFTLHRLTRKLFSGTDTEAVICWVPDTGWHMHHFDGFTNDVTVFPLEMVLSAIRSDCNLLFHLPEYAASAIFTSLGRERLIRLRSCHGLQVNILNQNIEQMPDAAFIGRLKQIFPDLTCTAGNPAWASREERTRLAMPLHILPTWYYPDDAPWQPYASKADLMIVSGDENPFREAVLAAVRNAFPTLTIRIIQGLKYEKYLELERSAKWSITFGEGLDGYFYGPVLRGGVAFAVRNGTFDHPGLENIVTVYPDYESMVERIADDMRLLGHKEAYENFNTTVRIPLTKVFSRERTSSSLAAFYRRDWSIP